MEKSGFKWIRHLMPGPTKYKKNIQNNQKSMRVIQTTLARLQDVLESLPKTNLTHSNYFVPGWALDSPSYSLYKENGYEPVSIPDDLEFYYESGRWTCVNAILVIDPNNE